MRREFVGFVLLVIGIAILGLFVYPLLLWSLIILVPLVIIGTQDYFQTSQAIKRNFPIVGRFRYLFETIRPEIYQYFVESDTDGVPFDREQRSLVYQRAKNVRDTIPFGTKKDLYQAGYEWVNHSLAPVHLNAEDMRITIGGPDCKQPYSASILNISAMSYGSLSQNAVLALSKGANAGNFFHNTGEGGISPYHLDGGADIVWQIGTGYFGCRTLEGDFNPSMFAARASNKQVKMIDIKLSQGAKPGHGGILPASKVTPEIARIRGVPLGVDVISPPGHATFSTPLELLEFVAQLRELSQGKPVGLKLCVGKRREFLAICKAMIQTGITPDYITVDGGEGGTGAAPLEFSNHLGTPLIEGLIFVHNSLVGYGLRDKITIIASGKVSSGFDMVKRLALGADVCNSARAMMMALGCIQALKCNTNHCPVGVATHKPYLTAGLVPSDKAVRITNYHHQTLESVSEIVGAMGLSDPADLRPWHIMRRTSETQIHYYGEVYEFLEPGDLLKDDLPISFKRACEVASAETFHHVTA
ncbi:MAG: glutamate synthase domain-containing protein 2 [Candidatus Promineifilaceae bacterium]|jgi:glutamate synthase domain-containing protein 2